MKKIIRIKNFSCFFLHSILLFTMILPLPLNTVQASSKKDLTIVIDPGHGGIQSGTQRGNLEEKTLNLKIAQYLKETVIMM